MKVITAVALVAFLAVAHGATCNNKCDSAASSCMTGSEAAACIAGYGLSSANRCVKCGSATSNPSAGSKSVGVAAGAGQWWEPWGAGKCTSCVGNCETCEDATTCKVCAAGYWPIATTSKTCTSCGSNCVTCASATTCQTCATTYFPKAGKCTKCGNNCKTCTDEKTCTKCDADYEKATDGNCVSCKSGAGVFWDATKAGKCTANCAAGCKTCKDATKCKTCLSGYITDTDPAECKKCTANNCAACANANVAKCTTCNAGYALDAKGACTQCGSATVATPNAKQAVGTGQWWDGTATKCSTCDGAKCKTCGAADKCADNGCKEGYITDATTNNKGLCKQCGVGSCATCKFATADKKCDTCKAGYIIDAKNENCVQCPANCKTCSLVNGKSQCDTCVDGFALGNDKVCVACTYDGGNNVKVNGVAPKANTMITKWSADTEPVCVTCTANCKTCNADGSCSACVAGSWPFTKDGKAGAQQTTNPATGGSCKSCDASSTSNCKECNGQGKCKTCKDGAKATTTTAFKRGYYAKADKCEACKDNNCVTCDANGDCTSCDKGYSLDDKKACVKCGTAGGLAASGAAGSNGEYFDKAAGTCTTVNNCVTAKGKDTCTTCKPGYTADAKNVCVKCTPASGNNCKTCNNGDLKKCLSCQNKDSLSAKGICSSCGDTARTDTGAAGLGKWFDAADGSCSTCTQDCKTCASKTTCADNGCNSGFITDAATANKGLCTRCGVNNCGACLQATASTLCTTCVGKFAQSADKKSCSQQCDAHATSCTDGNTAKTCDTKNKYYLASGRCKYCDVTQAGATAAGSKNTRFFDATTGGCFCCDPNADGCADASTPASCKQGYTKAGTSCQKDCAAGQTDTGKGKGKCYTCQAQALKNADIPTGFYTNAGGKAKGSCTNEWQASACNKNYYVAGSMVGSCCPDGGSAASGVFQSVATIAGLVAAAAALLH